MTDTKEREEFEWLLQIKGSEYHVDEQGNLGYANPFHHCMWLGYLTGLQRQQQRISELQAQLAEAQTENERLAKVLKRIQERAPYEVLERQNAELREAIGLWESYPLTDVLRGLSEVVIVKLLGAQNYDETGHEMVRRQALEAIKRADAIDKALGQEVKP